MQIMEVGLVRSLQPWDILLIYCNNSSKYIILSLTLARGALSIPLLMSMSEAFSDPFLTLIKLCYTKALEWSSLVPSLIAKSSSEITNATSFTISYQSYDFSSSHVWMWELDCEESWALKIDAFELWCWRRLLRVPWTARRSNQSILKEISPGYSLEGLML